LLFKVSKATLEALATNREEIKRSYVGINLNTKNALIPAMLPKVKPLTSHDSDVLGSIIIMKIKNQLMSSKGLTCWVSNSPEKKIRNPKIWGIFFRV